MIKPGELRIGNRIFVPSGKGGNFESDWIVEITTERIKTHSGGQPGVGYYTFDKIRPILLFDRPVLESVFHTGNQITLIDFLKNGPKIVITIGYDSTVTLEQGYLHTYSKPVYGHNREGINY